MLSLDFDPRNGGTDDARHALETRYGELPKTIRVKTPGGGYHYYFEDPGGLTKPASGKVAPGVDVIVTNAYTIAPGSRHHTGNTYELDPDSGEEIAALPEAWRAAIAAASGDDDGVFKPPEKVPGIIYQGERNGTLFRLGCSLRAKSVTEEEIRGILSLMNASRCDIPLENDEIAQIAASAANYEPTYDFTDPEVQTCIAGATHALTTRGDEVEIRGPDWFLQGRISYGSITLFDGPGGVGKTTLTMGIIAYASIELDFLTGERLGSGPVKTLIVGAEDSQCLLAARLRKYGADMTQIYFLNSVEEDGKNVPLLLPHHVLQLRAEIEKLGVGVVYIDALFSHLGMKNDGKMSQDARHALQPILAMSQDLNIVFLATRHWSKGAKTASDRALGSVEHTNVARSTFSIAKHPEDESLVVIAHTKSNLSPLAGSLSFQLEEHETIDIEGKPFKISIASKPKSAPEVTSDDLALATPEGHDKKLDAQEWLRECLGDGKLHYKSDIVAAAKAEGVGSYATMDRARHAIGAKSDDCRTGASWYLPTGAASHQEVASSSNQVPLLSPDVMRRDVIAAASSSSVSSHHITSQPWKEEENKSVDGSHHITSHQSSVIGSDSTSDATIPRERAEPRKPRTRTSSATPARTSRAKPVYGMVCIDDADWMNPETGRWEKAE